MEYSDMFLMKVKKAFNLIVKKENQSFDENKANDYLRKTVKAKLQESIKVVREDTFAANFNLTDNKKITDFQKQVMILSLDHFCTMYANEIFQASKVS